MSILLLFSSVAASMIDFTINAIFVLLGHPHRFEILSLTIKKLQKSESHIFNVQLYMHFEDERSEKAIGTEKLIVILYFPGNTLNNFRKLIFLQLIIGYKTYISFFIIENQSKWKTFKSIHLVIVDFCTVFHLMFMVFTLCLHSRQRGETFSFSKKCFFHTYGSHIFAIIDSLK